MHRLVLGVFKVLITAILIAFTMTIALYLYRAYTLDRRVQSVLSFMEQDVAKNNCLTDDAFNTYTTMLENIKTSMNNGDEFFVSYNLNYGEIASKFTMPDMYVTDLAVVGDYGDISIIQLDITIHALDFFDTGFNNVTAIRKGDNTRTISYVYQVPCLKYVRTT